MTQEEFTQKKLEGLKKLEAYSKIRILEDFERGLYAYFHTTQKSITINNKMPFTRKQVLAVIKEKYPDLKLKARYPRLVERHNYPEVKITPKKKYKILFWEVWI